jgi:hypothetical protein
MTATANDDRIVAPLWLRRISTTVAAVPGEVAGIVVAWTCRGRQGIPGVFVMIQSCHLWIVLEDPVPLVAG